MALAYTAPTWTNGSGEGISASNLQAMSDCIEGLVQGSDKAIHSISFNNGIATVIYADGSVESNIPANMKGISSIAKTGTSGLVDTYTILYTDGSTSTFTVTNGTQGPQGETGPQGPQGPQGPTGADGTDGVSPEVTISIITGGHRVTITDAEHPSGQNFDVMDGANSVIPNPQGTAVGPLESIGINGEKYYIQGGGTTIVQIPSVVGDSFTYNGIAQGPTITGLDSTHCTVTGATATNAGSYTLTIALNDPSSMVWSDLTNTDKTYTYTIAKADQTLTLSSDSVVVDSEHLTATVTVTGNVNSLNVTSSDTTVATVSESDGTITISSVNNKSGSATISVYAESSSNYNQSSTVTISVTAAFIKIVTWANGTDAEIKDMLDAHYAGTIDIHDYWSVGDERTVHLDAMAATGVGESHVAQDVTMVLMNAGGKTLTTSIGSVNTCAFIVGQKNILANGTTAEGGYMNSSGTNMGGWDQCARRTWCNEVYKAALPSTFVGILKQHQNITAAGTGSTTTTSSDYVALPAEKEVFGSVTYADSTAEAPLTQFKYYETASNRTKYRGNNSGSLFAWWGRSPYALSYNDFCYMGSSSGSTNASNSCGLAPFFCI